MEILGIIPARGGSKGIPKKNLREVAGKPLLAYVMESAKRSRLINRLVVSTDDPIIKEVSRSYKVEVVDRPPAISGDRASSESAILHALRVLAKKRYRPDLVVFLQCTSPLTLPEDIDGAIQTLLDEKADSVLAVTPFHRFLWRKNKSGNVEGINHIKTGRLLRQNLRPQFLEAGAIYVMLRKGFEKAKHRFFGKTSLHVMPPERCLEIDSLEDLREAEVRIHRRKQEDRIEQLPDDIEALVLDFDGVLTDNRVMVSENGKESVVCNRSDGWGVARLKKRGIPVVVLSSETNRVVFRRCAKLGVKCFYGVRNKYEVLWDWTQKKNISLSKVVFVGNDGNDTECLRKAGCGVAVDDAHSEAQSAARIVLSSKGGRGAVREISDLIIKKMGWTQE